MLGDRYRFDGWRVLVLSTGPSCLMLPGLAQNRHQASRETAHPAWHVKVWIGVLRSDVFVINRQCWDTILAALGIAPTSSWCLDPCEEVEQLQLTKPAPVYLTCSGG